MKIPKEELYGLTSQMRRAAVSVPSNIIEGCARSSQVEYSRFLEMALGSPRELNYQFSLAFRLGFIKDMDNNISACKAKLNEALKILAALFMTMR
jgi:four helix bundle protein